MEKEKDKEKVESSNEKVSLLGGDYVVVIGNRKAKPGTLFVEARIRDDMQEEVDTVKVYI
jgi:hypothetical protein